MAFFYIILGFVIMQRITELVRAKKNEKLAIAAGGIEFDRGGYKVIVLMHTCFFLSLVTEYLYFYRALNKNWYIYFVLFILAQGLRYWTIYSLGTKWNTRVIIVPGSSIVTKGPFRYMKHPNYAAVITELLVLPMMFSCYITAGVFTLLNLLVLKRRIRIEEQALAQLERDS